MDQILQMPKYCSCPVLVTVESALSLRIDCRTNQVHTERHVAHGLAAQVFTDCHGQQSYRRWQSKQAY